MLYHISLDANKHANPQLFDSRVNKAIFVDFDGARSFLEEYINRLRLHPISIYESHLPDRIQLICWYTMKERK